MYPWYQLLVSEWDYFTTIRHLFLNALICMLWKSGSIFSEEIFIYFLIVAKGPWNPSIKSRHRGTEGSYHVALNESSGLPFESRRARFGKGFLSAPRGKKESLGTFFRTTDWKYGLEKQPKAAYSCSRGRKYNQGVELSERLEMQPGSDVQLSERPAIQHISRYHAETPWTITDSTIYRIYVRIRAIVYIYLYIFYIHICLYIYIYIFNSGK